MSVDQKLINFYIFALIIILIVVSSVKAFGADNSLLLFAGAASKPATEDAMKAFQQKTQVKVYSTFGGSGFVLSQMKLAKKGDIYFPGSSDFMELAKRDNLVLPDTERIIVYLIPSINVQKGNPRKILSLKDLTREKLKIAIAYPDKVCVGTYAVEIIEKNLLEEDKLKLKNNIVNYTESCEKTANVVSLKVVDAVLGWRVFQFWDPSRIETVYLKPQEIIRIGYIPVAVSRFSKNPELARKFIEFLSSDEGKNIFKKYNYLMTLEDARKYAKPDTSVGGEYTVPKEWLR